MAGFGFGATLWVKLAGGFKTILWVIPWVFPGLLTDAHVMSLPGVQSVFVIYGVAFLVCVLLGSIVMVNPPAGYKPAGWTPPPPTSAASGAVDMMSGEMLATPQFYMLWLIFMCNAMAGLMVIGCIQLFGVDALQASKAAPDAASASVVAGTAMALYAILNGLGRIIWGSLSDKIGRKIALTLMSVFQCVMMLLFFKAGATGLGLIVGACVIGFNFGGNFALFPAATADFFGNKNVGLNYGWVFLSYGVAGILGPVIAGYFKDHAAAAKQAALAAGQQAGVSAEAWLAPFVIAAAGCLLGAVIAVLLKPPKAKHA